MAPGRHFSSQGEPRRARGTLRTAVAATVVAVSSALTILSASLDQASAQAVPGAVSSPPADQLVLRFTPPPGTSVRQHYINATVFRRLLGRFATTASVVRVCNLIVLSGDRFDAIRATVKPPRPDQRPNCLRQAVHFALQGAMGEAEFVLARQEEARFIARWTHPPARYPRDAVFASEVLSDADDYRYARQQGGQCELRSTPLPEAIEARAIATARALGLRVAGLDLRRTPDDEWYCFEVNPSPCFTYYEYHTGQPLTAAVASLLMSGHQ